MGNKFIPNYFYSREDFFNYILNTIDKSLINLNFNLFIKKDYNLNNNNLYESLDKNLNEFKIDNNYFKIIYKNFRKNNKRIKPLINEDKLFINNQIDELRSEIHSNLMNEYKNISIKPNISFSQLKYLLKFQKEKNFKIINCDKNTGNAILSNELYRNSAIVFCRERPSSMTSFFYIHICSLIYSLNLF